MSKRAPSSLLAFAAALGLLCGSAAAEDAASGTPRREIVVTGTGEASAPPDVATANFAVLRMSGTAREALDEADAAMARVIGGMKEAGIAARDLQTSGFAVTPQYRYDDDQDGRQKPPELIGYEVRNALSVRIRDMGKVGEVLDRAVTLGANSGGEIGFAVDDPAKLRIEARRNAVRDAMDTARALAEAAGVPVGAVVGIDARDEPVPPMPMARMTMDASAKAGVPVEAGETTVRSTVGMTFAIGGRR